ncbi:MAG: hypothetical protein HUU06_03445 [Planctomycetaceae bacterium]|nr:hypothetical protein [Planctomycetaceae bacterium]
MLIRQDSPFLLLPVNLDPRQKVLFDGLHHSITAADRSYARLLAGLLEVTSLEKGGEKKHEATALAFVDAWTILDSCNRLGNLVRSTPKWKKVKELRTLSDCLGPVVVMRNGFQHLNEEVPKLASAGLPAWGALHWSTPSKDPSARGNATHHTLFPGAPPTGKPVVRFGRPRVSDESIWGVSLQAFGQGVNFGTLMGRVEAVARHFETSLSTQFKGLPSLGSGYHFSITAIPSRSPMQEGEQGAP